MSDMIQFFKRTQLAASSLGGILNICKLQNYGRLDSTTSDAAIDLLVRDTENEAILFRDLDAVVADTQELRLEIARRRAALVTKG